jgi:ribosomal protein S18 acetylase RimI-like enzyme
MSENKNEENHVYKCSLCGRLLCMKEARFRTVCTTCITKTNRTSTIAKVMGKIERGRIHELAIRYWGEEKQLTFDKEYDVTELPAYCAKVETSFAGFIAFTEIKEAILIAALAVLPKYQNLGIGKELVRAVEVETKEAKKNMLLVSTSNDDLPALAFYQHLGFQIFEVKIDVIARKHRKILKGLDGLPIRDELRMRKIIAWNPGSAISSQKKANYAQPRR